MWFANIFSLIPQVPFHFGDGFLCYVEAFYFIIFLILTQGYIHWFERERKREGETSMREKNTDQLSPIGTPPRNQTRNLGMCPELETEPATFWCAGHHLLVWRSPTCLFLLLLPEGSSSDTAILLAGLGTSGKSIKTGTRQTSLSCEPAVVHVQMVLAITIALKAQPAVSYTTAWETI